MDGYSYTTITKHPGREADVFVSLYLDEKARIGYVQPGGKPSHVKVEHGDVDLTIAAAQDVNRLAPADSIAALRKLADALTTFAADLESEVRQANDAA